jgi:hypothetical protein
MSSSSKNYTFNDEDARHIKVLKEWWKEVHKPKEKEPDAKKFRKTIEEIAEQNDSQFIDLFCQVLNVISYF